MLRFGAFGDDPHFEGHFEGGAFRTFGDDPHFAYPDLKTAGAKMAKDRLAFDGTYTDAKKTPKEFRFWTSVGQGWFTACLVLKVGNQINE